MERKNTGKFISGNSENAIINGTALAFDQKTQTYYTNAIKTDYGKQYTIEICATIDGTPLLKTKTTPYEGFSVMKNSLGSFIFGYSVLIKYIPSSGTGFCAFSIVPPLPAQNFIYDNSLRKNN